MTKEEIQKKIEAVEEEIRKTPYDKSSEFHHGVLKAKLARFRDLLEHKQSSGSGGGVGYAIKHSGDASVVLLGLPSVGKSTLLNALTNADSKVGNYDFTTLGVVPGMMKYRGVNIQMLDLPGIIEGAAENKGFGKKVLSVARAADLILIIADVRRRGWFEVVEKELYRNGMRLDMEPPKVGIRKTGRGGIQVIDPFGNFAKETIIEIAKEMGLDNAIVSIGERLGSLDRLIDGMAKSRKYAATIRVVTKTDLGGKKYKHGDEVRVSANTGEGLEELREKIWQKLGLVRVYLRRERNGQADKKEPLIVRANNSLGQVLERISSQMSEDVSRALIWGSGARFPGQEVSMSFRVFDEMEVWFGR